MKDILSKRERVERTLNFLFADGHVAALTKDKIVGKYTSTGWEVIPLHRYMRNKAELS